MAIDTIEALHRVEAEPGLTQRTVPQLVAATAQSYPDITAIRDVKPDGSSTSWTYRELHSAMQRTAAWFMRHFDQGDHVAIWAQNSAEWIMFQLGAAASGVVLVTINPALRSFEASYMLSQSKAVGLIASIEYRSVNLLEIAHGLANDLPNLREIFQVEDWARLVAEEGDHLVPDLRLPVDHPALIIFTSGTTGKPKAVVIGHQGIVDNAALGALRYELNPGAVWLGALPLFHIGGAVTSVLGCFSCAGTYLVLPYFEPGRVLNLIETEKVAWLPTVPTTIIAMVEHENFEKTDLSSLRVLLTGGTVITPDIVNFAKEKFKASVMVMFGQTESGGGLTKTFRNGSVEKVSSTVGYPYPHTRIRIIDITSGSQLSSDQIGEIRIKSPYMMSGYFGDPAATLMAFDEEGFLRTGDLGSLDCDGYLKVTGRIKEMLIRGGENIYPREIEDALSEFPGVAEAAVVGIPSKKWGEEVAAAIRFFPGQDVEIEVIRAFLENRLARHKIPSRWNVVQDFPRSSLGKIQKYEIAKSFE